MTTHEVRAQVLTLKAKLGIVGDLVRCDVGDPEFDGIHGDLLALKALQRYLGDRAARKGLQAFGRDGALPASVVRAATE